ncbi:ParB/RepB/Spo0J family partition protein [Actinomadura violacea]|uniref:ParB N-terminal domain-containing protein n=1 Tax=Actinomadura violacea TaxID=2819934 RepID=A0ABS3S9W3_9ACTN|nr:ParB N-terminal domain-containing protein [Actinomadura violacea]MBO2465009.1 ParB N-terminal domain-containing protein [Actinomadura violacea]
MTFQVIAVDKLTPHPKHVRPNGEPSQRLLASVAARGVEEALDVVPNPQEDGSFWIVEGRRRWLAACKTGRPEVRCVVHWDLDEASQHLLQYLANDSETRLNHTERQQTLALTFAIGAGATRKEARSQLGLKAKEVQQHIHAGRLSDAGYQRATQAFEGYQPSILEQAILAEFEDDEEATERLLRGRRYREPMEAVAENIRKERADEAEHERLLAAFSTAGVPVTDDLPDGAVELDRLRVDDERDDGEHSESSGESDEAEDFLDSELHSKCPGRGVHFPYDLTEPVEYCTDPVQYGHGFADARVGQRMRMRAELVEAGETVTENLPPGGWRVDQLRDKDGQELTPENHRQCPGARVFVTAYGPPGAVYYCTSPEQYGHRSRTGRAARTEGAETTYVPPRDLVVRANREWLTAAKARRVFLAQLLRRRTAPTGTMAFLADQLLVMPGPVRAGLGNWRSESLFREFTGKSLTEAKEEAQRATTGRLHTLILAEYVAAMEYEIADIGDRRNTWRTDRANPYCTRDEASAYLKFLKDKAGHKPVAIEKAVILKVRYTGTDPDQEAVEGGTALAAAEDGSALRAVEAGTGQDAAADGAAESVAAAANEHVGQPGGGEGDGDSRPHETPDETPGDVAAEAA